MTDSATLAFEFGGRLSLDLTWTVRFREVHPTELLTNPERLSGWITTAGLPSGNVDEATLRSAKQLREAIYRAGIDTVGGHPLRRRDLQVLNRWAAEPPVTSRLRADGSRHLVATPRREIVSALATIALDAIDVLASGDGRLRRCEGPRCSLLFYDSSRPGTRRWCIAERCGNKVNTKAYRARHEA